MVEHVCWNDCGEVTDAFSTKLKEILIEDLELNTRSYNCLFRAGVQTVGDLIKLQPNEFDKFDGIRNLGKKTTEDICDAVKLKTGFDLYKHYYGSEDQ